MRTSHLLAISLVFLALQSLMIHAAEVEASTDPAEFADVVAAQAEINRLRVRARSRLSFLVHSLRSHGDTYRAAGDFENAGERYGEASEFAREAMDDPIDGDGQADFASILEYMAEFDFPRFSGEPDVAVAEAVSVRESLLKNSMLGTDFSGRGLDERRNLANALELQAKILTVADLTQARIAQMRALALRQGLADDAPEVAGTFAALALSSLQLGRLDIAAGRPIEAEVSFRATLAVLAKAELESSPDRVWQLAEAEDGLANALAGQLRWKEALATIRSAIARYEEVAKQDPGKASRQFDWAISRSRYAYILTGNGDLQSAIAEQQMAITALSATFPLAADQDSADQLLQRMHGDLADLLQREKRTGEAHAALRKSLHLAEVLTGRDPKNWDRRLALANAHWALARTGDDTRNRLGRAIAVWEQLVAEGIHIAHSGGVPDLLAKARAELAALPP